MGEQAEPIEQKLLRGKYWLNDGKCCGQVDSSGTCFAPACIFGEALTWFHAAHDEIIRQQTMRQSAESLLAQRDAEIAKLREALTPSAETKAAYIGEFSFRMEHTYINDEGEEETESPKYTVPWTTIKEIMAAIRARAAIGGE